MVVSGTSLVVPPAAGDVVLTGRVVAAPGRGVSRVPPPPPTTGPPPTGPPEAVDTMVTSAGLDVLVPGSLVSTRARNPFSSAS